MRLPRSTSWLACVVFVISSAADARQFRQLAPIPVAPEVIEAAGIEDAVPLDPSTPQLSEVEELNPIPNEAVESAIREILAAWNTEGLDRYLDQYFPNRYQLLNVLRRDIPKDATLRLLSVQNISTLSQVWGQQTQPRSRISSVIATVNLQLQFIDPFRGQVTLPHTARFQLRVVESE